MSAPLRLFLAELLLAAVVTIRTATGAQPPSLTPGATFTVPFPEMPPTFYDLAQQKDVKAQMTVFLPRNYDAARKHPLLLFLNGGDGGAGGNPGVARALTEEQDFICVSVPLFKAADYRPAKPGGGGSGYIVTDEDGRRMWPLLWRAEANCAGTIC